MKTTSNHSVTGRVALACFIALAGYLLFWPVPIDPVSWNSPTNPEGQAPYVLNKVLDRAVHLDVGSSTGPEAVALDANGRIYTGVKDGRIMRFDDFASPPSVFATLPPGRPLGLAFAPTGDLYVAHVPAGLIRIALDGRSTVVLDEVDGVPIRYADDVDVARDGTVYLSDATTKFDPTRYGGSFLTSRMDLMEHGGHGRLIEYAPSTHRAKVVVSGLQFANGVAMTHDDRGVLIVETGSYRVLRWYRDTPSTPPQVVAGPFPGFPDNVTRGRDGRYWVGLVSQRSRILDTLSRWPAVRRIAYRLPLFLQPQARSTGFVIALDTQFKVQHVLRGGSAKTGFTVSAEERGPDLIISRLKGDSVLRLVDWQRAP